MDTDQNDKGDSSDGPSLADVIKTLVPRRKPSASQAETDEKCQCPHCSKFTLTWVRFCVHCGKNLDQFSSITQAIHDLRAEMHQQSMAKQPPSRIETPALGRPMDMIRRFLGWNTVQSLLFFCLFSYLCLFGTALSEHKLGEYALIVATFGLSMSAGRRHAREIADFPAKNFLCVCLGLLFGVLVLFTQFGIQILLTNNFIWPAGKEYYEVVNSILGVTFAYLTGALFDRLTPRTEDQSPIQTLQQQFLRYQKSLLPLSLFLLTTAPKIINLF